MDSVFSLAHLANSVVPHAFRNALCRIAPALTRTIRLLILTKVADSIQQSRAPILNCRPYKANLGDESHGPRTLTRFNERKEENNRLLRFLPENCALALLGGLGSTITPGFTTNSRIA